LAFRSSNPNDLRGFPRETDNTGSFRLERRHYTFSGESQLVAFTIQVNLNNVGVIDLTRRNQV